MLRRSEIRPGFVLRLDPAQLLAYGCAAPSETRTRGVSLPHWFICVGREGDQSRWLTTTSKWAWDRIRITRKSGQLVWTAGDTYADTDHVWTVTSFFALEAAAAGVDPSNPFCRNHAELDLAAEIALVA